MAQKHEGDVIRNMLRTINEATDGVGEAREVIITDDSTFGSNTLSTEKDYFINGINSSVRFGNKPLIYYPEKDDLTFSGEIVDMNNLRFQFRLNDPSGQGVYIWVQGLQLTEANVRKLNLIYSLFQNWRDKWIKNSKLLDSFKQS